MTKIALDLGGSTARSKVGNIIHRMPSFYQEIEMSSRLYTDIVDKTSDFTIIKAPTDAIINKRYARGEATAYLRGVGSQVDNQTLKADQASTYVNAAHSLAVAVQNGHLDNEPITVGVCIPTSEFYSEAVDRVKSGLLGSYKLHFNLLNKDVEFEVGDVKVFPEGVVALFPLITTESAAILKQKVGIVIDAGRRSTDVTILNKFKPNAFSARSLPIGGINLESLVSAELEKKGYMVAGSELDRAISDGVISNGDKTVDVGAEVRKAKLILSGFIVEKLPMVLNNAAMTIRELNYVVYLGRCFAIQVGADASKYTGDLGEFILDGLQVSLKRIDVEDKELANLNAVYAAMTRAA